MQFAVEKELLVDGRQSFHLLIVTHRYFKVCYLFVLFSVGLHLNSVCCLLFQMYLIYLCA